MAMPSPGSHERPGGKLRKKMLEFWPAVGFDGIWQRRWRPMAAHALRHNYHLMAPPLHAPREHVAPVLGSPDHWQKCWGKKTNPHEASDILRKCATSIGKTVRPARFCQTTHADL